MGVIMRTIHQPDLERYLPEYNPDGTERHIICEGARFHVTSWSNEGLRCSAKNCEINRRPDEAKSTEPDRSLLDRLQENPRAYLQDFRENDKPAPTWGCAVCWGTGADAAGNACPFAANHRRRDRVHSFGVTKIERPWTPRHETAWGQSDCSPGNTPSRWTEQEGAMPRPMNPKKPSPESPSGFEPIPVSDKPCLDLGHNPPSHLFIPPGQQYRHICPSCGQQSVLRGGSVVC